MEKERKLQYDRDNKAERSQNAGKYQLDRNSRRDTGYCITLTSGKKIIVKESRQDVKNLVKLARKEIFASDKEDN